MESTWYKVTEGDTGHRLELPAADFLRCALYLERKQLKPGAVIEVFVDGEHLFDCKFVSYDCLGVNAEIYPKKPAEYINLSFTVKEE